MKLWKHGGTAYGMALGIPAAFLCGALVYQDTGMFLAGITLLVVMVLFVLSLFGGKGRPTSYERDDYLDLSLTREPSGEKPVDLYALEETRKAQSTAYWQRERQRKRQPPANDVDAAAG